ncbi:MAG: multicopper oxidase domain-containing protein [Phycisphaerales bacterium]
MIFAMLCVAFGPAASAQVVATFEAVADATLYEDVTGGSANGTGDFIHAGQNNGGLIRRALIRFNVSTIPVGSTITAASLRLVHTQSRNGSIASTVTLQRVSADWGEGTTDAGAGEGGGAGATPDSPTWVHRFFASDPPRVWTTLGGDFVTGVSASTVVNTGPLGAAYTWSGAGVISDVQAWVNGTQSNFGWIVRGDEVGIGHAKQLASRTHPTPTNRPVLTITFTPPPGAGACCFASGACAVTLPATCASQGGTFNGVGILCNPNPCPQPTGVCCLPLGACQILTPPACAAANGTYRGDNTTCAQISCPIPLAPFVDALPIPPIAVPTSGVQGGAAHYDITMTEFSAKVHRDLPPTRLWGYNGISPGPTILARRGQPVTVNWINNLRDLSSGNLRTTHVLPVETCLHGPDVTGNVPVTVVHLHGAKVAPASDGDPDAAFPPGSQAPLYTYPNDQPAATMWYHDHALGLTRLNVHMGLAAFYLIRDSIEDALALPRGEYDVPLMISDKSFNGDGTIAYSPSFDDQFFGDKVLVNGKVWPFLDVKRTKYRFRIVNASGTRTFRLSLSNGGTFQQIMSDGGLLAAPVILTSVTLMPSERADIVVDFALLSPGERVVLTNNAPAPFPGEPGVGVVPDVMQFRVLTDFGPAVFLPPTLASVPRIPESQAVVSRELRLQQVFDPTCNFDMWTINGLTWDDVTEFPRIGSTEIWSFANLSEVAHPLHVHLVQMQILDRQNFVIQNGNQIVPTGPRVPPPPNEAGWKDTVQVAPLQITRAIMTFDGFSGVFPYHCHILEHEDHEMMRKFEVLCDPPTIATPPTAQTVNEDQTAQFSVSGGGDVLTYQWRRNNVNLSNGPQPGGSVVSGATTNTLTIAAPDPRDAAAYTCVITNPCGTQTTTPVNLLVIPRCPGDLNFSNSRNTADLTLFLSNFARTTFPGTNGDLNFDGVVNTADLTNFLSVFGVPCP